MARFICKSGLAPKCMSTLGSFYVNVYPKKDGVDYGLLCKDRQEARLMVYNRKLRKGSRRPKKCLVFKGVPYVPVEGYAPGYRIRVIPK